MKTIFKKIPWLIIYNFKESLAPLWVSSQTVGISCLIIWFWGSILHHFVHLRVNWVPPPPPKKKESAPSKNSELKFKLESQLIVTSVGSRDIHKWHHNFCNDFISLPFIVMINFSPVCYIFFLNFAPHPHTHKIGDVIYGQPLGI